MVLSSFCPQCGAENIPGETYCPACQYPLDTTQTNEQDQITLLQERYQLLKKIGTGGFGAVYLARDTQVRNRQVAIKQIHLQGLTSQEIIEATDAFNREAEILSTLSHPLLPQIFDRFSDPEHWYLVMNFIDGLTLDEYLQQHVTRALPAHAGLSLSETLIIALQLCEVLHYLHTQQPPIIFRDLKPGNVMRTTGGQLYLIDFGIARRFKPGQIKDTIPFGSPGFAAPEQYGRAQTTPQADIYSLGALLYCLISGDDPADHPFQFPPLRLYANQGIRELDALIQRMVAPDPAQRPADMLAVRTELQHIQQIQAQVSNQHIWLPPTGQTPPATFSQAGQQHILLSSVLARRKTTRRRVLTGSLIAGGALLFGGIAAYAINNNSAPYVQPISSTEATASTQATETTTSQMEAVPLNGPTYWSPDLSHAAVVNLETDQMEIYAIAHKQLLCTMQAPSDLGENIIQWSADNSKILFSLDNNTHAAWKVINGEKLFALAFSSSNDYLTFAWSPDGKYLALGYADSISGKTRFILSDGNNGKQLFSQVFAGQAVISSLSWSPDSRYIAFPDTDSSTWTPGKSWSVEIWDRETSQKVRSLSSQISSDNGLNLTYPVSSIAWSPGGKKLAITMSGDGGNINYKIFIHSFDNTQPDYELIAAADGITYGPLWSPDEQYLAAIVAENLVIWDVSLGQTVPPTTYKSTNVVAFAWAADSKGITVAGNTNILAQW